MSSWWSDDTLKQQRWDQYKLWSWNEVKQLSEWEKSQLDKYIEFLEKEQVNNQKLFNKKPQNNTSNFDSFYDFFWWDPLFDNNINNKEDKDW